MSLHNEMDIVLENSFLHMNDITDCRTAYRIIRRHVYRNTHTTVQHIQCAMRTLQSQLRYELLALSPRLSFPCNNSTYDRFDSQKRKAEGEPSTFWHVINITLLVMYGENLHKGDRVLQRRMKR